jgi:hypothetical protein
VSGDPIENLRMSIVPADYTGGGTTADAVLDPEKKKDYPEPAMFDRIPSYALFARHVTWLDVRDADFTFATPGLRAAIRLTDITRVDMDHVRAQKPGTPVRAARLPVHLEKVVKATS